MIKIDIPGRQCLEIREVVFDYNGTIAVDGIMPESVKACIRELAKSASVRILTADTYGTVREQVKDLGVETCTFPREGAAVCKQEIVEKLPRDICCIGNGYNDIQMFEQADLRIAVMDEEGVCARLLSAADICVRSMEDACRLLLNPDRIRATLRN